MLKNFINLASYQYESALHIGTDSGNGHFASALGLPTVTIVNRRSTSFAWRPNWASNIIVRPGLSKNLVGNRYWKYTISENRVLESVKKLLRPEKMILKSNTTAREVNNL